MMRMLQWKWLLRISCAIALLACVMPVSAILYIRHQGASELQRVKAKIAAEDPNWELDDLAKELNAKLPPDDKNPFLVVEKAHALLPATYEAQTQSFRDVYGRTQPINCLMLDSELVLYDKLIQSCAPALQATRPIVDMPEGGRVLNMPRNPLLAPVWNVPIQNQRTVAAMLRYDAIAHAMHNRPDQAIESCRCILGTSRAIGSEPSLVAQLARMSSDTIAVEMVEQILNMTEPKHGLAELQADLLQHAKFQYMKPCTRGERALIHRTFEVFDSGEIQSSPVGLGIPGGTATYIKVRMNLSADHAYALNQMNRYVAASQLPSERQIDAINKFSDSMRDMHASLEENPHILSFLLLRGHDSAFEAAIGIQSRLAAASVAVACERYRQKFGKWPKSLEAIPKDILPAIPLDPCSGKPILYKRLKPYIVVKSVCTLAVQIYNPSLRRQPTRPMPSVFLPPEKEPDEPDDDTP